MERKITESEENEIYLVISKALQSLCQEKPNDAIEFLSKKMLEIIGDDPKWNNHKKKAVVVTKNVKSDDIVISSEKIDNKGFVRKFSDFYKIKKQLTFGPRANTYYVYDLKRNNELRIVKMMKKAGGINSLTLTELQIDSLLNLNHPHIGLIYDILEDEKFIYMVQDFYENGDLFSFLMKNKKIHEKLSKVILKQLLAAVRYLHENNIMHRGIKPQNIFIIKYDEKEVNQTMLKLCDFGSATYFRNCVPFTDFSGNPAYSAPENIQGNYDNLSDVWSVGIIAYFLLSGTTPFKGKDYDILFKVMNTDVNFSIIEDEKARAFVMKLLQKDPNIRASAEEALEDEWLATDEVVTNYIDDGVGVKIFSNMSKFIMGDSLRRSVYTYIVSKKFYSESNTDLLKLFKECDINNDGRISGEELLISYGKYFPGTAEEQLNKIHEFIDKLDINKSGYIEYSEFLTINNILNLNLTHSMLKEVFDFFDVTKNGSIQIDDLKEIFEDFNVDDEKIQAMLREFDKNGDQEITFNEFYEILTSFLDDNRKDSSNKNIEEDKHEEATETVNPEQAAEKNNSEEGEGEEF